VKPRRRNQESSPPTSRDSSDQAATRDPASPASAHPSGTRALRPAASADQDGRPLILLVDQDRLSRGSLARVLLRDGFDVTAADTAAQVLSALSGGHRRIMAIVSLDGLGDLRSALHAMLQVRPSLPLLALTRQPHALTEHALQAAGVRRFGVVSQHMPSVAIADGVRQLLRATTSLGD
jgi:hypothetical protein